MLTKQNNVIKHQVTFINKTWKSFR